MQDKDLRDMVIEMRMTVAALVEDVKDLQKVNSDKDRRIINAGWNLIKAAGLISLLTWLSNAAKDGCKLCKTTYEAITGLFGQG